MIKKQFWHEQYKECLFDKKVFHHGMNMLRSEGHKMYGLHVTKKSQPNGHQAVDC